MFSSWLFNDWSGWRIYDGVVKRGKLVLSSTLNGASMSLIPGKRINSKIYDGKSWYLPAYLHKNEIKVCFPVFYFPATKTETFSFYFNPICALTIWIVLMIYSISYFLCLLSWVKRTTLYFLAVNFYWDSATFFSKTVSTLFKTEMIWTLFFLHNALKSSSIQI